MIKEDQFINWNPTVERQAILINNLISEFLKVMSKKELKDYLIIEIGFTEDEYKLYCKDLLNI